MHHDLALVMVGVVPTAHICWAEGDIATLEPQTRKNRRTIRQPRDRGGGAVMAINCPSAEPRRNIPNLDEVIHGAGCEHAVVWAPCTKRQRAAVAAQHVALDNLAVRGDLPDDGACVFGG